MQVELNCMAFVVQRDFDQEVLDDDFEVSLKVYFICIETIPILRQQKDWVSGSRKWTVVMMFSTVFMLIR